MEKRIRKFCSFLYPHKRITTTGLLLIMVSLLLMSSSSLLQGQTDPDPPLTPFITQAVAYRVIECQFIPGVEQQNPFCTNGPDPGWQSSCFGNAAAVSYDCNGNRLSIPAPDYQCIIGGGVAGCARMSNCLKAAQDYVNLCLSDPARRVGMFPFPLSCGQVIPVISGPYSLTKGQGDGQTGPMRTVLPLALEVGVSASGGVVSGVPVNFSITGSPAGADGQQVSPATGIAGCDGLVRTTLTLGDQPGSYKVTATCSGCTNPVEFTATATGPSLACANIQIVGLSPSEVQPAGTSGINSAQVTVEVRDDRGELKDGCKVNFDVEVKESKGHAHDNPRDPGSVLPAQCTTGEGGIEGRCMAIYQSTEVSGVETLRAELDGQPDKKDERDITIRVPGLSSLPDSDKYQLAGRFGEPGVTSQHTDNHNGTATTLTLLQAMAGDYFGVTGDRLCINDMSLPWGGLFDIGNNWAPPHGLHRIGKSADVNTHAECFSGAPPVVQQDRLDEYATLWFGRRIPEGGRIHYEFP